MNSGALARSAGVTIRALRHYHQVGVLPEPPRSSNGYRDYGPEHLLHVLRIKRATAAGVPLEQIRTLLTDPAGPQATQLLEDLEHELDTRIADLAARRDVVRQMRHGTFEPSIPAELVPMRERGRSHGLSTRMLDLDLDQAALLLHLLGPEAAAFLDDAADLLADAELLPTIVDLAAQFERIDEATADRDLQHLAQQYVQALAPVIAELRRRAPLPEVLPHDLQLLEQHRDGHLNSTQRAFIRMITQTLDQWPLA